MGGEALYVDAMYFQCSELPQLWQDQLYRAAGSLFNILLVLAAIASLHWRAYLRSWLGYFLWITAIINGVQAGSYIGFGRFIHSGMDWPMIAAAAPDGPWNTLFMIAGVVLIVVALWSGWRYMPLFLAQREPTKWQRLRLLLTPLLTATVVSVAASLLVPSDDRVMMLMGGIGNSLFFLAPMLLIAALPFRPAQAKDGDLLLPARWKIVGFTAVTGILYIFVLAPGLTLS